MTLSQTTWKCFFTQSCTSMKWQVQLSSHRQHNVLQHLRPQTRPNDLGCESACRLPETIPTIAILLLLGLLSPKADTHFTIPRRVEGWVDLGTAVMVRSMCPRLYMVVMFTINTQLPEVVFEPWSSHTAIRHVTIRPLRPASMGFISAQFLC